MSNTKKTKLHVEQFEPSAGDNFSYLVYDSSTSQGVIIDAPEGCGILLHRAKKLGVTVEMLLLTHTHFDHTKGIKELLVVYSDLSIAVYKNGAAKIKHQQNIVLLEDGDTIAVGKKHLRVLHTPGHIPDAVCFYDNDFIFSGDTVFISSHGRTDFEGGNSSELHASFEKLRKLPDHLVLYAGHSYNGLVSTLGAEKNNY